MIKLTEHGNVFIDDMYYDKEDLLNANRLQRQLIEKENTLFTIEECINIWQTHSNDLCASWLCFPDNDEGILDYIKLSPNFTTFEHYSK